MINQMNVGTLADVNTSSVVPFAWFSKALVQALFATTKFLHKGSIPLENLLLERAVKRK